MRLRFIGAAGARCAALFLYLALFCGEGCGPSGNTTPHASGLGPALGDSVALVVDSVTVNGLRTDSLFCAFDSVTCDTLAVIRLHFSQWPRLRYAAACNMVVFDNGGNSRYECYTCAMRAACAPGDSVGSVSLDSADHSLSLRSFHIPALGNDTGSVAIHITGMFDDVFLDSTELDTTIRLFW